MSISYKRIDYKVAPIDSRLWKCNWRLCAGGYGLKNCGICAFRGRWDISYCPLFITIANLEAKSNAYKHWSKIAESAVGALRYFVCGKEIIMPKKLNKFEVVEIEPWMTFKGKTLPPRVVDLLDSLKMLHEQKENRAIKTALEDLGSYTNLASARATVNKYTKAMGFRVGMVEKDKELYVFIKAPKESSND